ncbi:MAG: DUF6538 domain-containing protein [Steroidobacteraceae bacterium]
MVPHLLERGGTYYYNRRVPKHAVDAYGATVRVKLSQDRGGATELAKALTVQLDQAWSSGTQGRAVDVNPAYSPNARCRPARVGVGGGLDRCRGFGTSSSDGSGLVEAADG